MKKFKKHITATNILIIVLVIFYLLDCYLPLPMGYTGYNAWDTELTAGMNYIFGYCGGLLKNYMAMGSFLSPSGIYRHITCMFLHGGLLHLIANLVGLYFIGNYTEKRFGWWLTYLLFFLIGFAESFITDPLFIAMFPSKAEQINSSISVGASSGIFGIMGVSLAAILFDIKSFKKINKSTLWVSIVYGILTTYVVSLGWTTVCHNTSLIIGLTVGTLIILPFYLIRKSKIENKNQN